MISFDIYLIIKRNKIFYAKYGRFFIALVLFVSLVPFISSSENLFSHIRINKQTASTLTPIFDSKLCLDKKISSIIKKYPQYINVVNKLNSYSDFNGKVYSFPGDPIFYVLFNQKPPYYSSIYEASPIYAQKKLVEYISEDEINYIAYNKNDTTIQDNVPNTVRAAYLNNYIVKNFSIKDKVGSFLILYRNKRLTVN